VVDAQLPTSARWVDRIGLSSRQRHIEAWHGSDYAWTQLQRIREAVLEAMETGWPLAVEGG
jgi:hypothetical protein